MRRVSRSSARVDRPSWPASSSPSLASTSARWTLHGQHLLTSCKATRTCIRRCSTRASQSEHDSQNTVCEESSTIAYGGCDREFDFGTHEWRCSEEVFPAPHTNASRGRPSCLHVRIIDIPHCRLRAAPLVRAKVKITVKNAVCCRRRLSHTAFLTGNLTLTRTSGAALTKGTQTRASQSQSHDDICRLLLPKTRI